MHGHDVPAARRAADSDHKLGDQRVLPFQRGLTQEGGLDSADQARPLAFGPRRQTTQRANRPLPRPLRCGHRLHQQIVGVGPVLVPLGGLADEHKASISETQTLCFRHYFRKPGSPSSWNQQLTILKMANLPTSRPDTVEVGLGAGAVAAGAAVLERAGSKAAEAALRPASLMATLVARLLVGERTGRDRDGLGQEVEA